MYSCELHYIPKRLHWDKKPLITVFRIGDLIYRRCKPEELENPFGHISLREISHNVGTANGIKISIPTDVLYNVDPEDENEIYEGRIPCIMDIKELNENQYCKTYEEENNIICVLRLVHDPLPCMYSHCNFSIWINEEKVTKENYDTTLNIKLLKKLRIKIRQELALMIKREEIRLNFD